MKNALFTLLLILSLLPVTMAQELPAPKHLQAELVQEDGENHVMLTWSKEEGDSLTTGYYILVNFPPKEELLVLGKAGIVFKESYKYPITNNRAAKYRFAVMGVQNFPKLIKGPASNIVEVMVPSSSLPIIEIASISEKGQEVSIMWKYTSEIADLKGFRIYMNDKILHDENSVTKNQREWSYQLSDSGKYIFQISAVSESGVESRLSQKRLITIK